MPYYNAYLKQLSDEDVIKVIEDLGGEVKKITNNAIVFSSICCKPEKYKLYYWLDSKKFYCFLDICNCKNYDLVELVSHIKNISKYEAFDYIQVILDIFYKHNLFQVPIKKIDDFNWINKFRKKNKEVLQNDILDEKVLNQYIDKPYWGWVNEGIGISTQYKYGIKYDLESNRIIIPKYNVNGQLIGVTGRTLETDYSENDIPKYFPLYSYSKSIELYGLWKTKEAIKRKRKIIIFEAEKSVMKCEEIYGDDNFAVAVEGSSISDEQIKLILQQGVNKILLAFDKEYYSIYSEEYQKYRKHLLELASKFRNYADVYLILDKWNYLSYKDAPIDRGKEVLETLLNKKEKV
jgi:hypothetical protein